MHTIDKQRTMQKILPLVSLGFLTAVGCAYLSNLRRRARSLRLTLLLALKSIANNNWNKEKSCVILSGGLDSCIVAEAGADILGLKTAITVIAADTATDLPWATACAQQCGLTHHVIRCPSLDHLLAVELPTVVKVLKSFDPMSLRNEIAISAALRAAAEQNMTCAVTGDGADELLGGYTFTHNLTPEKWKHNQRSMAKMMRFGSVPLGAHFGIRVTSPFTQSSVIKAALRYSKSDCVCEAGRVEEDPIPPTRTPDGHAGALAGALNQRSMGKMPLRAAFPEVTSAKRGKDPIEVGCGTTQLSKPQYFDALISDTSFQLGMAAAKADHGVLIRDKEHLRYFQTFMDVFPGGEVPGKLRDGPLACPACRYSLSHKNQTFCLTCGLYDPTLPSRRRSPVKRGSI